jgi:uncharacterized membrane protein YeaQ/YmgE (transglycosylase-associated protein family)
MHVIWFILFGLVVGAIARFLMPGRQAIGMIMTSILGMAGSFVGALLANIIRGNGASFEASDPFNWIGAIVGSLILLFLFGRFAGRTM